MDEKQAQEATVQILTEVAKDQAGKIYEDGLQETTKEASGALSSIVGLFNHVVLYPVKKANINFRYKLEEFEKDLQSKVSRTPEDKVVDPPLTIAGPTLESLKYTFDVKELREMYLELLASAMNSDTTDDCHPFFVESIKAMNSNDAIVLREVSKLRQIAVARVAIGFEQSVFSEGMPSVYAPDIDSNLDPFVISKSLHHLCQLGILTLRMGDTIKGYNYESIKTCSYVQNRLNLFKSINPNKDITVTSTGGVIQINDFGKSFVKCCLP